MSTPKRTNTGLAYLTFDSTLNTDASMIEQQIIDLSGNTNVQTFCENAFKLSAGKDISGVLLSDIDITDYDSNNLVYLGSTDVNNQKTFLNNKSNSSKAQNIACNAYNMSLGVANQKPLISTFQLEPEPEPEPEPIPEPEPEPEENVISELERFWDLRANTLKEVEPQLLFNQVKLIRVTSLDSQEVQLQEIQVFIGDTNVARNGTTSASSLYHSSYDSSLIIDGVVEKGGGNFGWCSATLNDHLNTYVMITLDASYNVNDIQYIVLHNQLNVYLVRSTDCNIQLLLDGVLVSEVGPTIEKMSHEITGPASTTLPSSMITNSYSETGTKLYRPSDSNDIDTSLSFSVDKIKAITDSKGGIVAPLNNFTDADTNLTGLTFDGSTKYIDLTANSINVGGDETIGNGFSFETYVKNDPVISIDTDGSWNRLNGTSTTSYFNTDMGDMYRFFASPNGDLVCVPGDGSIVRVYRVDGSPNFYVSQLGSDFPISGSKQKVSGSFSFDGSIFALYDHGNASANVYQYDVNDNSWNKLGDTLSITYTSTYSVSVCDLSSDGSILGFGGVGTIYTYKYDQNNNTWITNGDIDIGGSEMLAAFKFDSTANRAIIGTPVVSPNSINNGGSAWVYKFNESTTTWSFEQRFNGTLQYARFGHSVDISSDGSIVIIGGAPATGNFADAKVKVYRWNGTSFTEIGDFDPNPHFDDGRAGEEYGRQVSINSDGTIIAISHYVKGLNETEEGTITVYRYISDNNWTLLGDEIYGGYQKYELGRYGLSLSGDGSIIYAIMKNRLVKYEIGQITQRKHILALGDDDTKKLELTTGENTTLSLTNSESTYDISSNSALSSTEFSHIVCIIQDSSMNLYIDNTLVGSVSLTPFDLNTTLTKNYLGSDLSNGNLFKGTMAYFKTWLDYGLLTNEISDLYDNRIQPEPEPEPEPEPIPEPEPEPEIEIMKVIVMYHYIDGVKNYIGNTCDNYGQWDTTTDINNAAEMKIVTANDTGNNNIEYERLIILNRVGSATYKINVRFANPYNQIRFDENVPYHPSVRGNDANMGVVFSEKENGDLLFNQWNPANTSVSLTFYMDVVFDNTNT
jgi:hypothetical protein